MNVNFDNAAVVNNYNADVGVKEGEKVVEPEITKPENEYGFVAVCAGEGLEELFSDIGADTIVSGGQTMNPSTDDILNAIMKTPAKVVFVLPNNKNIIMAAEQAAPLAKDRKHSHLVFVCTCGFVKHKHSGNALRNGLLGKTLTSLSFARGAACSAAIIIFLLLGRTKTK